MTNYTSPDLLVLSLRRQRALDFNVAAVGPELQQGAATINPAGQFAFAHATRLSRHWHRRLHATPQRRSLDRKPVFRIEFHEDVASRGVEIRFAGESGGELHEEIPGFDGSSHAGFR